jgi:hypothetical protein
LKWFIWADKLALVIALAAVGLLALIWFLGLAIAGQAGARHLLASIGAATVDRCALAIAVFWLVLRLTDFAAGGQTHLLIRRLIAPRQPQSVPSQFTQAIDQDGERVTDRQSQPTA